MIPANDKITQRQLFAVIAVSLMSPLARRIPSLLAAEAGNAAWLSVAVAAVPLALFIIYLRSFLKNKADGFGLREMFPAALGNIAGKAALVALSLWLLFYAGFLLRVGADRFISTVYPNSSPTAFIICMAVACLVASLGQLKGIARSAMIFRPLLLGVFLLILFFSFMDADLSALLPITERDLLPAGRGVLTTVNTLALSSVFLLVEDSAGGKFETKTFSAWLAVLLAIVACLVLSCIGIFGPKLTASITYPFFALARETSIFGVLERTESLMIGIWVLADFILISALLFIAARNLKFCFGISESKEKPRLFDLSHGKWLALCCAFAAVASGLLLSASTVELQKFSESIIPLGNAIMDIGLLPAVFIIGRLRKKL